MAGVGRLYNQGGHVFGPPSMSQSATTTVLEIQSSCEQSQPLDMEWIHSQVLAAIRLVSASVERVNVRIVSDTEMVGLHGKYCGLNTITDVLTFPQSAPGAPVLVDIAICVDEASRRAIEIGHPIERELLLYTLHGLLHCTGFDDRTEADHAAMHAEEDRILTAIGIGPVFQAHAHQRDSTNGAAPA